jgi:hypothetical protein
VSQVSVGVANQPRGNNFDEKFRELLGSKYAQLDELQRPFVRTYWLQEITHARRRRNRNRIWFQFLRFVAVGGALALPALASLNLGSTTAGVRWATFIVSIVVTLSTAGLQVFRFGSEWGIDEEYANALETEGWAYFQKAGKYERLSYPYYAFQEFFQQLEKLRSLRNAKQVTEIIAAAAATATASENPSAATAAVTPPGSPVGTPPGAPPGSPAGAPPGSPAGAPSGSPPGP